MSVAIYTIDFGDLLSPHVQGDIFNPCSGFNLAQWKEEENKYIKNDPDFLKLNKFVVTSEVYTYLYFIRK